MGNQDKRAAIYARTASAQEQENHTEDEQIKQCRAYVQEHGYLLDEQHIYSEISDAKTIAEVARPFDVLVICTLDQLSRNQTQAATIIGELEQFGITVECADGYDVDELMLTQLVQVLKEAAAQEERQMINQRIKHGIAMRKARQ